MVDFVNNILSGLTVVAQVLVVLLIISLVLYHASKKSKNPIAAFFSRNVLLVGLIVSLVATLGSLFYSEIALYIPCKLCWLQRIFMYPMVAVFGVAFYKKDYNVLDTSLILSVIGGIIAVYHYILQNMTNPFAPCSTIGYGVSCTEHYIMNFGYVTIPLMAASAFALIIVSIVSYKLLNRK